MAKGKHYVFALALLFSVAVIAASTAMAQSDTKKAGADESPSGVAIGQTIADFKLPDISGKQHALSSLKGKNGTVLIFVSVQCPISNAYNERMEKLAQDYSARGISVIGINSNATESSDQAKHHAAENKLTFPILKDKGNKIADLLGAQHTPEAFFLDAQNKLVYHGRIDNARNPSTINSNDLRDALDATLAGKPVAKTYVRAFGCSIKRASM